VKFISTNLSKVLTRYDAVILARYQMMATDLCRFFD